MKSKFTKKVLASVMAAAMAVSATAVSISSMTAFAGEELGSVDFNSGAGLPWHICESATGTMKFEIANGVYNILITNPGGLDNNGEGRWDCQFRHRGLTIEPGHTYRLTYSIWTNKSDSKFYSKIGDMTDDDAEFWHMNGTKLNMEYKEGMSQADVEAALKSASPSGQTVDYGMAWDGWKNEQQTAANKWTTYAYEFTIDQANRPGGATGTGEWTFHLGGTSAYNSMDCCTAGTLLKFDNMALIDMTDDSSDYKLTDSYQITGVEVNQVGYFPKLTKKATLIMDGPDGSAKKWELKDSSGSVVASGETDASRGTKECDASGTYNQVIDFSSYTGTGKGFTLSCDGKTSLPFNIGDDILGQMTTDAMNYFYQNRSDEAIEAAYITSAGANGSAGDLAREAGHPKDMATVQESWAYIIADESQIENGPEIDVTGGWYDAGDHGKYVVNGGVAMWTLLSLYESDLMAGDDAKWKDGSKTVVVPESGNGTPDILDEVKEEADFFARMQRDDGMVYHKMHDYKWTALCVKPSDDPLKRIVKPVTYAATLNFAAAMAQYARLAKDYDKDAAGYLTAAEKAYKAAKDCYKPYEKVSDELATYKSLYAPLAQNKGGGPYGDTYVEDEFYWAACELYIATGDSKYKTDLMSYKEAFEVPTALYGGENNGSCSVFTWGTLASLGTYSLSTNADAMLEKGLLTQAEVTKIKDSVIEAGDYFVDLEDKSDFGIPYVGHDYDAEVWSVDAFEQSGNGLQKVTLTNGYEWGSNSMVINNAIALAFAYDASDKDVKYLNGVATAFDYILGRNALEQSYVTGYGTHATQYPHHRWWSGQLNSADFPFAPNGVLSGGPNSEMQDPMIQGEGYKAGSLAPMKCYLDNVEAWSVNECTINWNSPLVWIASFLEDEAPKAGDPSTTTTKPKDDDPSSSTTTATKPDDGSALIGDVNCDGIVDLSDAVTLSKYLAKAVTLTPQGQINADCDQSTASGIDDADLAVLLRFCVMLIMEMPVK